MKKQLLKSALIAMAGVCVMAGSVMADAFGNETDFISSGFGGAPSLQDIINNSFSGFADALSGQTGVGLWNIADIDASGYRVSYNHNGIIGNFGIYDASDGNTAILLGPNANNPISANFRFTTTGRLIVNGIATDEYFSDTFGFFYTEPNSSFVAYTEKVLNSDGISHTATYLLTDGTDYNFSVSGNAFSGTVKGNNDWLMAFEVDGKFFYDNRLADWDVNDAVFMVEDLTAVPEPTTMLLFGTGIASLAGIARRRKVS